MQSHETFETTKTDTESDLGSDSDISDEEQLILSYSSNLLKILGLKIKLQVNSVSSQSTQLLESLSQLKDFQRPPRLVFKYMYRNK